MSSTPFRFVQRRTTVAGRVPALSGLLSGEFYLQLADGTIYFKNASGNALHTVITDASGFGLNKIKFSGASAGDFPIWDGNKFIPYSTGNFITTGQTGSFGGSINNYQNSSILNTGFGLNSIQQSGSNNYSSGNYSVTLGSGNLAEKDFSFALGNQAKTSQFGEFAFSNGSFSEKGDSQYSFVMARATTTNSTATKLKINNSDKIVEFDLGSTIFFTVNVVGVGDTQYISNEIRGIAKRSDSLNSQVSFLNTPSKSIYANSNSNHSANVVLSTSDNSLKIECIGDANEEMNWFAKIDLVKIKKQKTATNKAYFKPTLDSDWYSANWYSDSSFSTPKNSFVWNELEVYVYNTGELPYVNIDNPNWVTPLLIDTTNSASVSGLNIISTIGKEFTGTIIGPAVFSGAYPVSLTNNLNLYFSGAFGNDWFNAQNWFITDRLRTNSPSIPNDANYVYMYGQNAACVNIDNANWTTPLLINTQNVLDPHGIYIISSTGKIFNGNIIGNSTFSGANAGNTFLSEQQIVALFESNINGYVSPSEPINPNEVNSSMFISDEATLQLINNNLNSQSNSYLEFDSGESF
jgi:hypothetical protein